MSDNRHISPEAEGKTFKQFQHIVLCMRIIVVTHIYIMLTKSAKLGFNEACRMIIFTLHN